MLTSTNINKKYKDRTPEETINIIINFFKNKGYTTDIILINNPTENIWWCRVVLKYKEQTVLGTNGKGTTELFAKASGYAELYERYCNFINSVPGVLINRKNFYNLSKEKRGYFLFPDEKLLTPIEAINIDSRINNFCNAINDNENSLEIYLETNFPEGIISVPYKGFNINDEIILPFDLLRFSMSSDGMAAGNTVEEALTQGLSELVEHYVHDLIFYENKRKMPLINYESLQDIPIYLQEIYNKLIEKYKVFIYDFSYLYNVPVVGLLVVDTQQQTAYINLAAAPVFYLALERCFTEIYQGYKILGDSLKHQILPFKDEQPDNVLLEYMSSLTLSHTYPESLLINTEIKNNYNTEVFLPLGEYTNQELNQYYKNLFNNLQWQVYYRDYSQSKEIAAIQVYLKDISVMEMKTRCYAKISKNIKRQLWKFVMNYNKLITDFLTYKKFDYELLDQLLIEHDELPTVNFPIRNSFFSYDLTALGTAPSESQIPTMILFRMYFNKETYKKQISHPLNINKDIANAIKYYAILFLYKDNYSIEEIIDIANIYNINYSITDVTHMNNLKYLIEQTILKPAYNYYYSNEFKEILTTYL